MIYKINIFSQADDDLAWFRKNDRKSYSKCFDLVRDVVKNAREGIGKPERLRYYENEVYSRRVNHKDRMVYVIRVFPNQRGSTKAPLIPLSYY